VDSHIKKKTPWLDIETAPRDGQWFYACQIDKRHIYRTYWCAKRECFIHTKIGSRVDPMLWKWDHL